jgi:hypothetical protein
VPFTLRNIRADLEDIGARFEGAPIRHIAGNCG